MPSSSTAHARGAQLRIALASYVRAASRMDRLETALAGPGCEPVVTDVPTPERIEELATTLGADQDNPRWAELSRDIEEQLLGSVAYRVDELERRLDVIDGGAAACVKRRRRAFYAISGGRDEAQRSSADISSAADGAEVSDNADQDADGTLTSLAPSPAREPEGER